MQRRLENAFPNPGTFRLKIYEENSRHQGVDDEISELRRKEKVKAPMQDPAKFGPNVNATFPGIDDLSFMLRNGLTFPGIDNLPLMLRNGHQTFSLLGSDIVSRGKAIGIPLGGEWWLNIDLRMHGHVVVISKKELVQIDHARLHDQGSDMGNITIQLALINSDEDGECIAVVDRFRLATLTFTDAPNGIWYNRSAQGPCPITEIDRFKAKFNLFHQPQKSNDSIFKLITKRQDFFNGIGTSHANEILHLAMEHPAQKASVIFGTPSRKERLLQGIVDFFSFAHDDRYKKAVPAGRSGGSAFSEPKYITKNIISLQQRVYGHTKSPTKISKAHYAALFDRGLLDQKYKALGTSKLGREERDSQVQSKMVDVYAIRFVVKKDDELKVGQYAYTVMATTPPGCVAVRYEPPERAIKQALGSRRVEIGIASFTDNAPKREFEDKAFLRRFPVKTGKRGRPRKSKNAKLESSFARKKIKPIDNADDDANDDDDDVKPIDNADDDANDDDDDVKPIDNADDDANDDDDDGVINLSPVPSPFPVRPASFRIEIPLKSPVRSIAATASSSASASATAAAAAPTGQKGKGKGKEKEKEKEKGEGKGDGDVDGDGDGEDALAVLEHAIDMDEGSEDEGEEVGEDVLSGPAAAGSAAGDKMLGLKDSIPAKTYSF